MRTTRRRNNRRPRAGVEAAPAATQSDARATARSAQTESVVGERIVAGLIDLALTLVLGFVLSVAFAVNKTTDQGTTITGGLSGWHFWLYIGLVLAYGFVCEGLTGKTLGKKLAGIRVVSTTNERLSWPRAFVRNMLRPIDAIPGFYAVGLVVMLATKRKQRIGDLVAGTIVVRD
jgi:uncharacterized RDD family membrane protein YckC